MDIVKQVDYWQLGSEEDIAAAEALVEKGYLRHGLFFAHLAVEKILKAHVVRKTAKTPPYIHNLIRLAEIAELALDSERLTSLRDLAAYQLAGRYPDMIKTPLDSRIAQEDLGSAKEMIEWLTMKL